MPEVLFYGCWNELRNCRLLMKNTLLLLAIALTMAAFAGMMSVKTDVQTMDRERTKLVNERAELRETKRVLEAEWALLASPGRLARLVRDRGYVAAAPTTIIPLSPTVAVVSQTAPKAVAFSTVISTSLATPTAEVSPAGALPTLAQ